MTAWAQQEKSEYLDRHRGPYPRTWSSNQHSVTGRRSAARSNLTGARAGTTSAACTLAFPESAFTVPSPTPHGGSSSACCADAGTDGRTAAQAPPPQAAPPSTWGPRQDPPRPTPINSPQPSRGTGVGHHHALSSSDHCRRRPAPVTTSIRRITQMTLDEVKNAARLSYTRQLRDYGMIARSRNLEFNLYIRPGTRLSRQLEAEALAGRVKVHRVLP